MQEMKRTFDMHGYNYDEFVSNKDNVNRVYGMMIGIKNDFTLKYIIDKVEITE